MHLALVVLSLAALQPFDKGLQLLAMTLAVRVSLAVHLVRLIRRCPIPRKMQLNSIQEWLRSASMTTEGFYLFGGFILLSNPSGSLLLLSGAILAAYHALSFGQRMGARAILEPVNKMAASYQQRALFLMGFADIGAWVQLFVSGLATGSMRGLIQSIVYLNLLRQRYNNPSNECRYYKDVWRAIGDSAVGRIACRAPFFDSIVRWFCSGGR